MKYFNIHHKSGMIIDNVKAATLKSALSKAQKKYGPTVYVSEV